MEPIKQLLTNQNLSCYFLLIIISVGESSSGTTTAATACSITNTGSSVVPASSAKFTATSVSTLDCHVPSNEFCTSQPRRKLKIVYPVLFIALKPLVS